MNSYKKLFYSPQLYKDNVPFEWNWRTVSHIVKNIGTENPETFNFVTSINRINGEVRDGSTISLIDRIDLSFDINSIPAKNEDRFSFDEIKSFFESVPAWHESLKSDILKFLE